MAPFAIAFFVLPIVAALVIPTSVLPGLPLAISVVLAVGGFLIWPVRTLALFALFVLFTDTIRLWTGDQIKFADEIIVPIIGLITLVDRRHVVPSRISPVRDVAVAVLVLGAVLSSLANGVPPATMLPGLLLLGKGIAVFYIALVLEVHSDDVQWCARLVLGVALLVLALGAVELVAPSALQWLGIAPSQARAGLPALKSAFYHPQLFGWFCAFIGLYMFAHHVVLRRPIFLVLGLLFSLATILSARRKAIFGLAAGLGVGIATDAARGVKGLRGRLLRWLPSAIGVLAIGIAFLPAFATLYQLTIDRYVVPVIVAPGGVGEPGTAGAEPDDTPARVALYVGSVEIARDHFPIGAGLGRYGSWISREQYSDLYVQYGMSRIPGLSPQNPQFITDTFWPQILGETGVIGLAAYVTFLTMVGVQLWRQARRTDIPPAMAAMVLGTTLIFAQTLVESLASPILNSPSQTYLVMLSLGAALSYGAMMAGKTTAAEIGTTEATESPITKAPITEATGSH